jgi:hypothetical protein
MKLWFLWYHGEDWDEMTFYTSLEEGLAQFKEEYNRRDDTEEERRSSWTEAWNNNEGLVLYEVQPGVTFGFNPQYGPPGHEFGGKNVVKASTDPDFAEYE